MSAAEEIKAVAIGLKEALLTRGYDVALVLSKGVDVVAIVTDGIAEEHVREALDVTFNMRERPHDNNDDKIPTWKWRNDDKIPTWKWRPEELN